MEQNTSQPPNDSPIRPTPSKAPASQPRRRQTLVGIAILIAQRLAFGALVLLSIIYLSFLGLDMAQGTLFQPALTRAASNSLAYLSRLSRGDLGLSAAGSITLRPIPVSTILPDTLAKSLGLLAASLLLASLTGVALGAFAANHRHSSWSLLTLLASTTGVSLPSFFAALLLQLAAIRWTQTFGHPLLPVGGFGWDSHLVLPALVLAARPIAQIARVSFVSLSDALDHDFVRTAHSKGLHPRLVLSRHVIRNAAIPILTTISTSLRFSLSSLPVVEFFFGWPGLGFTLLKAISRQDLNLTVALTLCLGLLFIAVNLLLDIAYRLIDPRLRQTPPHIGQDAHQTLPQRLHSLLVNLRDLITHNPISNWLARRRAAPSPSPFRAVLEQRNLPFDVSPDQHRAERRRAWLRGTLGNLPFVAGGILVAALVAVFVFGPRLAPHSPYTTQGLVYEDGQFSVPPFSPNDTYPWGTDVLGRDIMSLILAGAQRTLSLALLVVAARMALGFALGAVAGWLNGSWIDRLLLGAAETIAAFPTLLLAMILILALGIRQGMRPFVVALCFVGWGEIMQFVRGEVMAIRPKPFIESAVAVGLRTSRIILSHVLPNLIPALISLAALEMGAVLMLLGELGFIGIFIGGGAFAELDVFGAPYHYSDVPEWGSLLSNARPYARSYTWTAIYPSLAFFIAILGFNLFGEGIRRMVERVGMGIVRLVNRYTVAVALLAVAGIGWARGNTGAVAFYHQQASAFDGERALAHVEALTDPALQGRALGTQGMEDAADYIAQQFQALDIQAAGEDLTYFQTRKRGYETLDAVPELSIEDGGPPPAYHQDYVEYPGYYRNLGQVRGEVRFLAVGEMMGEITWFGRSHPALRYADFSGQILLLLSGREFYYLERSEVPCGGILVVADDQAALAHRYTLSPRDPSFRLYGSGRQIGQDTPILWISEATANRLLKATGHSVADLRRAAKRLDQDELIDLPTEATASMQVEGTIHEKVPVRHVIGHLPGKAGYVPGGSGQMDDQVIVVLAQYDNPPPSPEEVRYPGANNNASGVAVMLEAIRTIQETGYQPYRTFLFVAYSGEGIEASGPVSPLEVGRFLQAKHGFSSLDVEAVVDLRALGAGQGDGLVLSAGGSMRLANVFEIGLSWEGWEETARLTRDTLESVSADKLQRSGRVVTLALMILGRETQY